MSKLQGWKTLLFGILTVILGFLESQDWAIVFGENNGLLISAIGIVIIVLRTMTNGPSALSSKK